MASKTLLDAVTAQVGKSGEFWQDEQTRITPDAILKFCQNFLILDEGLDVFRFAHLTVDEYLGTKLMVVESHVYISEICLSLLCSLHYPEKYDQTLRTDKGKYTDRHLLLYSAVFWPWHFSCCEAVNDYNSNILNIVWNMFILVSNYLKWLLYYQSVIEWGYNGITGGLFWRKSHAFAEQKTDDLLCAACVFGLSRTFTILFESRFSIELEDSFLD